MHSSVIFETGRCNYSYTDEANSSFCFVKLSNLPFLQELELLAVPEGEGQLPGEYDTHIRPVLLS